jgi:molecular chaperone GrpE
MADHENGNPEDELEPCENGAGDMADIQADEEASPEAQIAQLEQDLGVVKDRMLRLAAELENTRRRADREKQDAAKFGISNFARDMLTVADNFQRALDSAPDGDAPKDVIESFINGIQLTEKEMMAALQRHGVIRLEPAGEKFDPNLHQAIAKVPGNGAPAGIIVDVVQPGFIIGERVLRPAMVTVSNGAEAMDETQDDS